MIADYHVLIDSCVLANQAVADLLLRLSIDPRLLVPHWSEDILEEVKRTHLYKLDWPPDLAKSFQNALRANFPEALITKYEPLIPSMTNNEKDRHVLAAAVRGNVDAILTFNLKDFKSDDLVQWDIEARHPQDFLLSVYSMNPVVVVARLSDIAQKKESDIESVVLNYGIALPKFSSRVHEDITGQS